MSAREHKFSACCAEWRGIRWHVKSRTPELAQRSAYIQTACACEILAPFLIHTKPSESCQVSVSSNGLE